MPLAPSSKTRCEQLRYGLALGGEPLLERVRKLVQAKPRQEEVRWVTRTENAAHERHRAQALAAEQPERLGQIWLPARLHDERRVEVARACGCRVCARRLRRPRQVSRVDHY